MKNSEQPLVTIVTATYNLIKAGRKDYFLQMVNSVKNQTYKNIEHLIIDGASDDGTIELIKSLGLKYISEKDNGIYDAMNKGLKLAQGKYINFMNSDDYFDNDKVVEICVNKLEKTNADFCFGYINILNEKNEVTSVKKPNFKNFYTLMPFGHQSMFTKTDVMKLENGFDLNFKSAADYDFIIRLYLKKYRYTQVNETIANFREIGESVVNFEKACKDKVEVFKKNYYPYLPLTDIEYEKMFINNCLPFRLLILMKEKRPAVYIENLKRKMKILKKWLFQFHFSSHKERRYLKLFGKWLIKSDEIIEVKTLDDYFKSLSK